jgi:lysophospholipase L1-like esterase
MSPAAMHFASGDSFFSGILLIVAAHFLAPGDRATHPRLRRGAAFVLLVVGAMFVVLSSTPLPAWIDAALVVAILPLGFVLIRTIDRSDASQRRKRWFSCCCFMGIALVAAIHEWNATRFRAPTAFADDLPIYVIGDSISAAGTDRAITAWPDVLRREGRPVINLARIGATASSAMKQARLIPSGPAVVHVLIGGNDFFGSTSAAEFESDLAELLQEIDAPKRAIVVWELPLPPLHHAFGRAQRRQIASFGAAIVSKRILSRVLSTPHATVDGIHLSQLGQQLMARAAIEFLPTSSSP